MLYIKETMPISTRAQLENAQCNVAKQQADIDYIAMMLDVEIPTQEVTTNESQL